LILARKKEDTDQSIAKVVAYTIILYISSLFVPFIVVSTYQSMVYFSRSYWFFSTPISAYITFMGAMLYIAVLITFYLIIRQRWKGRKVKWGIGILLLASIPAFLLSLTNYYYLDDSGIHYNSLKGMKEKEYKWENIAKVHIVYRNHQGTTGFYQYKFEMNDGAIVTIPYNDKLAEHKFKVEKIIKTNHIPTVDNYNNPIVD
jgi:hypothetical protein